MNTPADDGPTWPAFARAVIECALRQGDLGRIPVPSGAEAVCGGGAFVTLRKFGHLRGCMGTLETGVSLAEAVRSAAISAALHDPRFPPVGLKELPELTIEVSILSAPWPMREVDELEVGRHGIIVSRGNHRGLFLPQVATEHHFDKETFLSRCCSEKAGLPPSAWREPGTEVLLFTAEVFSEKTAETGS